MAGRIDLNIADNWNSTGATTNENLEPQMAYFFDYFVDADGMFFHAIAFQHNKDIIAAATNCQEQFFIAALERRGLERG